MLMLSSSLRRAPARQGIGTGCALRCIRLSPAHEAARRQALLATAPGARRREEAADPVKVLPWPTPMASPKLLALTTERLHPWGGGGTTVHQFTNFQLSFHVTLLRLMLKSRIQGGHCVPPPPPRSAAYNYWVFTVASRSSIQRPVTESGSQRYFRKGRTRPPLSARRVPFP